MPGSTVEYVQNNVQPITNFNNLVYSNLVLSGTGNKTAPADTLTIAGNFSKTGQGVLITTRELYYLKIPTVRKILLLYFRALLFIILSIALPAAKAY